MPSRYERVESGELFAYFGKDPEDRHSRDLILWSPRGPDGHLLNTHLGPLLRELDERGYDLDTFRFSIKGRPQNGDRDEWDEELRRRGRPRGTWGGTRAE